MFGKILGATIGAALGAVIPIPGAIPFLATMGSSIGGEFEEDVTKNEGYVVERPENHHGSDNFDLSSWIDNVNSL